MRFSYLKRGFFYLWVFFHEHSRFTGQQAVPYPDNFWHRLNGMGAQKKAPKNVLVNVLFPHIFHVKTK